MKQPLGIMTEPRAALGFMHYFVPGDDPGAPVLLLLHGTGGDEGDLLPFGQALFPGSTLLSPRGQVLENGMPRFFRRLPQGVFDQVDLARRTAELGSFIEGASREYRVSPGRVIAVGFSDGANIAASLLLRDPTKLAGAILVRPIVPFVPTEMPDLQSKPVLLLAGSQDPVVPPNQPEQLADILRSAGANVTLHWEAGGHTLTSRDVSRAREWLRQNTPPAQ